jgi:hypothetical protein
LFSGVYIPLEASMDEIKFFPGRNLGEFFLATFFVLSQEEL